MRVYTYDIEGTAHCKEGWAVETEDGLLLDTYWSSDRSHLSKGEITSAKFRFDTDDFEEIEHHRGRGTPPEWLRYAPEDRNYISSQHGLSTRWFIRKGASPDLATELANQHYAVEEAESELRAAQSKLSWERNKLAELEAKAGESASENLA